MYSAGIGTVDLADFKYLPNSMFSRVGCTHCVRADSCSGVCSRKISKLEFEISESPITSLPFCATRPPPRLLSSLKQTNSHLKLNSNQLKFD